VEACAGLEQVQGRSGGTDQEVRLSPDSEACATSGRVHRRGLCHCDLKRAANILVGEDGRPYLIDWSAAILEREFRFFPARLIYRRFLVDDRHAVIKLQLRHCPEAVDPEDLRRYQNRSLAERAVRNLRDRARGLLQKVA
jgi:serine/threonine protein kinase